MLSINAVAARLGLHHQTVRKLIKAGTLLARRIGGVWRIDPDDLDIYLSRAAGETRSTQPEPTELPAEAVGRFA